MEIKKPYDLLTDGILAHGVRIGRFIFEEEKRIVYVLSDMPHIGPSDAMMVYQISKDDYNYLLSLSLPDRIPDKPVSADIIDSYHELFLCGESAYCKRNRCSIEDIDMTLTDELA
ncbi:MAG: hypothetical protein IK151_06855 [Erysipelotrichaceae bacterium]|nr:hypothetical protein [Erysipelotrichaceae bacterium]